jgi:hypothetical protein
VPLIVFAVSTFLILGVAKIKLHFFLDLLIYPTAMVAQAASSLPCSLAPDNPSHK